jgi:dTDP-4-dehydrorhamnose 3,5-epimerase
VRRIDTALPGVCLIEPVVHGDERGFFLESYRRDVFRSLGIDCEFVQDNHSRSLRGVLRGLHYQLGRPQDKLVRVLQGEIFDVAVDVRRGSPTFGRWAGERLSASRPRMIFVPRGFAHGFYVLSEAAEILYKCSDVYVPAEERGILWNDPALGIDWPLVAPDPILSARDRAWRPLADQPASDLPIHVPSW